jgi:hypothetical protein
MTTQWIVTRTLDDDNRARIKQPAIDLISEPRTIQVGVFGRLNFRSAVNAIRVRMEAD